VSLRGTTRRRGATLQGLAADLIDVVDFNGYATLGTIGHPASEQAHLTITFERPDMGRILFNSFGFRR
jgi:hypothetical protein